MTLADGFFSVTAFGVVGGKVMLVLCILYPIIDVWYSWKTIKLWEDGYWLTLYFIAGILFPTLIYLSMHLLEFLYDALTY